MAKIDPRWSPNMMRRPGSSREAHHDERGFASMHIYHVMIRAKYLKYFYF